jgi:hypothetical protein
VAVPTAGQCTLASPSRICRLNFVAVPPVNTNFRVSTQNYVCNNQQWALSVHTTFEDSHGLFDADTKLAARWSPKALHTACAHSCCTAASQLHQKRRAKRRSKGRGMAGKAVRTLEGLQTR